jgi:hypothetical protein
MKFRWNMIFRLSTFMVEIGWFSAGLRKKRALSAGFTPLGKKHIMSLTL